MSMSQLRLALRDLADMEAALALTLTLHRCRLGFLENWLVYLWLAAGSVDARDAAGKITGDPLPLWRNKPGLPWISA
jgi:hypothetical protein